MQTDAVRLCSGIASASVETRISKTRGGSSSASTSSSSFGGEVDPVFELSSRFDVEALNVVSIDVDVHSSVHLWLLHLD